MILGRQGIINSTLLSIGAIDAPIRLLYTQVGVVLALAQVQMPLMTLPLITSLGRIDMNLEDASCSLGAGSWRTFWKVVLPLSLPGVIAGCTLTYAAAITAFITQSLIGGGQMLFMPMYLYQQASTLQNWPFASAISICLSSRGSSRSNRIWHAGPVVPRIRRSLTDGRPETHMGGHQLRSRHDGRRADRIDRHHRTVARRSDRLVHQRIYRKFPPPGYSARWYAELWNAWQLHFAAKNSFIVATWSTGLSIGLGVAAALAIARSPKLSARVLDHFLSPLATPRLRPSGYPL